MDNIPYRGVSKRERERERERREGERGRGNISTIRFKITQKALYTSIVYQGGHRCHMTYIYLDKLLALHCTWRGGNRVITLCLSYKISIPI